MLSAFANAFRIPDLRIKILFTLAIIAISRLGSFIPLPGVDYGVIRDLINQAENSGNGAFNLINLFSGGALTQLSIFALGIMPYITASIIMQLLGVVVPRFEQLRKEGELGQKKLQQYTRYVTIGLALLQAAVIISIAQTGRLYTGAQLPPGTEIFPDFNTARFALAVTTLTAGTALIMWMGELVTQRGIGNGMSLLIFASIVSQFPSQGMSIIRQRGWGLFAVFILIALVILVAVVFVEQAQRRIPVQYARRMVGRKMYGGSSTYIPLKLNQSGVIPIIFTTSLLYLPVLLAEVFNNPTLTRLNEQFFSDGSHPVYMVVYFLLILLFAYFYNSIAFNPVDTADNMKKYGGFIPGIRPGRATAEYLQKIMNRITLPGASFLGVIAILPLIITAAAGLQQQFPFGGTAILIAVGVGLEIMKQIESQLMMRNYEGFLR